MPVIVHRAERADALAEGLAALLVEPPDDPFEHDLVVVSAHGLERWLAQRISHRVGTAPDGDDGICAGVDFKRPAHLVAELTDKDYDDPWAPGRLAWTVLDVIDDHVDDDWLRIVAQHVGRGMAPGEEALRRSRRFATAQRTAGLLHGYALQRPWMVQAWREGHDVDGQGRELPEECRWQARMWREVTDRLHGHSAPDLRLAATAQGLRDGSVVPNLPARLSFFGHTRMPAAELGVVAALGERRDVHLWLPHPSRARWEQVESAARHPGPIARADIETPETGNTLLTSCARDVTELEHALLALPGGVQVEHVAPPQWADSLLGRLQQGLADDSDGSGRGGLDTPSLARSSPGGLLDQRAGALGQGAGALGRGDRSVQVHACHGPARQIGVLREVLLGLLQDDPTLEPRDILIMCPDVEAFAPLIQAAFGLDDVEGVQHPGHRLRVRLADRATSATNPVAEVLQHVVAIAAGARTTAAQVRDLMGLDPVRRRFGLSDDDLETLDDWLVHTAIRWGIDAEAREPWGLGGLAQNTWANGLDQLTVGIMASPGSGNRIGDVLGLDDLTSTDVDLIGRVVEAVTRLGTFLRTAQPQPLDRWIALLSDTVHALTDVAPRDAWQREQVLRGLGRLGGDHHSSSRLTVVELGTALERLFAARPGRTSFRTGSLTVCTMVPMRSVPHRVVCLVGLDSGAFPRTPTPLGDDVLARHPLVGERDAAGEDRQLFLDAVMSATEHLVITYTGANEYTGRSLPPATPVGELLDQLDRVQPGARDDVVVRHPLQAFDARSFTPGALVPDVPFSFDAAALAGARAVVAGPSKKGPFLSAVLPPRDAGTLTLDELRAFVSHPVRSFVRGRLDVTLPFEADPDDVAIPLELDHLQQWKVNDRVLRAVLAGASGPEAEADERRRGLLPPGGLADQVLGQTRTLVGGLYEVAAPWLGEAASVDVDVVVPGGQRVVGTVHEVQSEHALRVTPSKLVGRQLLLPWVDVLALAAAGHGVPFTLVGRVALGRGWGPGMHRVCAPSQQDARALLAELVDLARDGATRPLPLPVKTSQAYATALRRFRPEHAEKAAQRDWSGSRDKGIDGEDADPYHALAFGERAPLSALVLRGLDQLSMRLWTPLLDRLEDRA